METLSLTDCDTISAIEELQVTAEQALRCAHFLMVQKLTRKQKNVFQKKNFCGSQKGQTERYFKYFN